MTEPSLREKLEVLRHQQDLQTPYEVMQKVLADPPLAAAYRLVQTDPRRVQNDCMQFLSTFHKKGFKEVSPNHVRILLYSAIDYASSDAYRELVYNFLVQTPWENAEEWSKREWTPPR